MAATHKPLVLLVDDNPDWLMVLEQLLRDNGCEVMLARSCDEASAALRRRIPNLLLLDDHIPGSNPYEFCNALQHQPPLAHLPVVFLTESASAPDRVRARSAGAADHLSKASRPEALVEAVRRLLLPHIPWERLAAESPLLCADFVAFRAFLAERTGLRCGSLDPQTLYEGCERLGLSEPELAQRVAEFCGLPYVAEINPQEVRTEILPADFCRSHAVVAVGDGQGRSAFAIANPFDLGLLEDLAWRAQPLQTDCFVIAPPSAIASLFHAPAAEPVHIPEGKLYRARAALAPLEAELSRLYSSAEPALVQLPEEAEEEAGWGPTVKLIDGFIRHAIEMDASDIHIEPWEDEVVVRYRIDGDLRVVHRLRPQRIIQRLVARVKIMASLNITEHRLPQDGRIHFEQGIDLRVSTVPMVFGEKAVMRILDERRSALPLDRLGFSGRHLALYREKIRTPWGLILHVGPTGSGKSMTMFSALGEIQCPELNIMTIEDPIEYRVQGINQMQVHPEIGLTFHRALRSFLRQDPDVILVGEIRDRETAEVAIEAANTGHLLLSTLHTNDAGSTILRFLEMGVEPYLVSSSVVLVCAQRLVRRVCLHCREAYELNEYERDLVGIAAGRPGRAWRAKGCPACDDIGYAGRVGVHELMSVDDTLRAAITRPGTSADELKRVAVERCGMTTLFWDAMEKVRDGVTTLAEALAQVRTDDFDARPEWMFTELGLARKGKEG